MISPQRITGIMIQEIYITKRSLEVLADLFFFSTINVVVFGFVSVFLRESVGALTAHYLFIGIILWEIIRVTQYSISMGALWNIWSRNLSNMFIAPLSVGEYFIAQMISGLVKCLLAFGSLALIANFIFDFNILAIGVVNLMLIFLNLTFFAWSMGIMILGIIFRYGTRIQAFAWALIFLFQPLTAAFFPLDILPGPIKIIAYAIPATHAFEAARQALSDPSVNWQLMSISFVENIVYLIAASLFFQFMFKRSREVGQFARNEG